MSHESTIRDLRAKAKQLEGQKRELDKQVEAIHSTIRIFEQNDSSIEVIPTTSPYAETLTKDDVRYPIRGGRVASSDHL